MTGLEIKMFRHTYRLRQWQLAARLGYSAAVLSDLENEKRPVSPEMEEKIRLVFEELKEKKDKMK